MNRRRFISISAATTGSCVTLAGCLAEQARLLGRTTNDSDDDESSDIDVGDDDLEIVDPDDDHRQDDDPNNDEEHDGRPITGYELEVHDERSNGHPLWIDQDGRVYGRASNRLTVSNDWYKTTETLYSFPREHGTGDDYVQNVIVPDNGRILVGRGGRSDETTGKLELVDKDLDGHETVYEFDYGRTSNSFGHVVYDDIIIISTYERSDFEAGNHANEVILSTDGGKSFELILEAELYAVNAANLHIHDVEYDPYAERIWVAVGDSGNTQIYWSDDLGASWETMAERGGVSPMVTQVVAFEDRVVFGTDSPPDGIVAWERDGPDDEPAGVDDLTWPHLRIEEEEDEEHGMRMYARRRWHVREEDGRELCLMPFGYSPMHPNWDESVVLGTVNGFEWYELFRVKDRDILPTMIIGPLSMDGDRRMLVSDSNFRGGHQYEATVPAFWE